MLIERGTIVGSYRVEGILGRGGMGVVYSASHVGMDRRVALKVLADDLSSSPEFVERFRREGRLQASLDHPHTVTVYEAGESEHGLYLAMRLVPGPTRALLYQERALDATRGLALLRQVGDALDAAHSAGLVHRDVKPQNVLVGDSEDAYLGDFGLVRDGDTSGFTATGRLLGTIAYLAPEVIQGGAFLASKPDNGEISAIFVAGLFGHGLRRITPWATYADKIDCSPDGTRIVFSKPAFGHGGKSSNVYAIKTNGTGVVQLTRETGGGINAGADSWSPDGMKIAYVSNKTGTYQIWTMNADGSGAAQLTHGPEAHLAARGSHP